MRLDIFAYLAIEQSTVINHGIVTKTPNEVPSKCWVYGLLFVAVSKEHFSIDLKTLSKQTHSFLI